MIKIGVAGVPIRSKERSTLGGLRCIAELKLQSMEVQFVRGVGMSMKGAEEVGELAKSLNIELSVHCPYYTNLCSPDKKKLEASKIRILESCERAEAMGARIAVFHPGFYVGQPPEIALKKIMEACDDIANRLKKKGIKNVKLGLETMGKISQFGSVEEIIKVCKKVKNCVPTLDFAHINCRTAGGLRTQANYAKIFDALKVLRLGHYHCHFTGAEFSQVAPGKGNERYHLELKSNKPPFEPLAKEILKRKPDITIISESPVLEQDSLVMKGTFERLGHRF